MLTAKNELLAALAAELEVLSPGAGAKAVFESPKVAAHGDFAQFVQTVASRYAEHMVLSFLQKL